MYLQNNLFIHRISFTGIRQKKGEVILMGSIEFVKIIHIYVNLIENVTNNGGYNKYTHFLCFRISSGKILIIPIYICEFTLDPVYSINKVNVYKYLSYNCNEFIQFILLSFNHEYYVWFALKRR